MSDFDDNLDSVDEIKKLYAIEAEEHLHNITEKLLALESGSTSLLDTISEIYRPVHSIKGDSNVLGFTDIGETAHNFETFMQDLKINPEHYNHEMLEELFSFVDKMRKQLAEYLTPEQAEEIIHDSHFQEEHHIEHEYDGMDEIKAIYKVEANEHIENIISRLLDLESEKISLTEAINEIYRSAHSIKGDSNTLGFKEVGAEAHEFETFMSKLRSHPKDYNHDSLEQMFHYVEKIKEALNKSIGTDDKKDIVVEKEELITTIEETKETTKEDDKEYVLDDSELKEIINTFLVETEDNINGITTQLLDLESEKISLSDAISEIYRLAHSIKGDANAVGFNDITDTAHEFETFMSKLQETPEIYNSASLDEMFNYTEKIKGFFNNYKNPDEVRNTEELQEENDFAFKDGFASSANLEQKDELDEITSLYSVETYDHLNNITNLLLDLESGNRDLTEVLVQLYRAGHSIKGDSNALGFKDIGNIAHDFESFIGSIQKNEIEYNSDALDDMFAYVEKMRDALDSKFSLTKADKPVIKEEKEEVKEETSPKLPSLNYTYDLKTFAEKDFSFADDDLLDLVTQRATIINKNIRDYMDIQEKQKKLAQKATKQDDETIRVSISKIDKLINLSGEMLISKISQDQHINDLKDIISNLLGSVNFYKKNIMPSSNELEKELYSVNPKLMFDHFENINQVDKKLTNLLKAIKKDNARFSFLVDEFQYDSINTRMLPSSFLIEPMKIVVRNTSKKLNKKIQFRVEGDQIEIDRFLIEKLKDPFGHIIRNAIDHGIETQEERALTEKSEVSTISIDISISGNDVVFEVSDDGRGLNFNNIKNKALKLGLITQDKANLMSEDELKQLIFLPGFSTAEKVTEISGRGVGLDVVNSMIEELGGKISVASELGKGTTFKLSLPLTLSTFEAFLIKTANQSYVVPKSSVSKIIVTKNSEIVRTNDEEAIIINDKPIKVIYLSEFLGIGRRSASKDKEQIVLLIESGINTMGILVDDVYESTKMYIKNLGNQLRRVKNISGATILGTGEPVLILNIADIIKSIFQEFRVINPVLDDESISVVSDAKKAKRKVLVVDDSITTRTLEKNILELAGFEVFLAKNGLEGKDGVVKHNPDLVITDVEMPKMNGFEFTTWIKKESNYAKIPVIMVTSLATDEFKQKGIEAGVDSYIIKGQFDQKKLLDTIDNLI